MLAGAPRGSNTDRLLRIVEDCLDLEAVSNGRLTTVRFAMQDGGAGVTPEQLRALFQRCDCRDAPGRRRVGGLGMGLAFVRAIAEVHGGSVGATSEHGRTTVWVEVPLNGER